MTTHLYNAELEDSAAQMNKQRAKMYNKMRMAN